MRTLVQLSDLHIRTPGELACGRVDTAACLRRAVDAVRALVPAPVAVLASGDLVDAGRPADYAHLRALLAPLAMPVYLMPGNHDARPALRAAFADHGYLQAADPSAFIQYAVDLGGMRLVVADTLVPGADHGELCAARLASLGALLDAAPAVPTLLALHHPPFATFIAGMDALGLRTGEAALRALVERHGAVERVLCGHLHRGIQARWAGTLALTAPSTAHQLDLDLSGDAQARYRLEPPGYLVHAWDGAGRVVTHPAVVGGWPGPYPF